MGRDRGGTLLRIGIDDTDSARGMCTTYLGFRLAAELRRLGARFADYPRLVRLNPNVPWRTRGNGAVGLVVRTDDPAAAKEAALRMLEGHSETANGANPAAAFIEGEAVPRPAAQLARAALHTLIGRAEARRFPARHGIETESLGNGQGIVGAVAAAAYEFGADSTLELLCYRRPAMFGAPRRVDAGSVRRMQEATRPRTFSSYDERAGRSIIAPRGPDPVLYGIRGEDLGALLRARRMVDAGGEEPAGYAVYRTNQGTGEHLRERLGVAAGQPAPYASGTVEGTVERQPAPPGPGGHVYFAVRTACTVVGCAAYRRSGLAGTAAALAAGDAVRVGGGMRPASRSLPRVLNAEVIEVVSVAPAWRDENPRCAPCGRSMKSRGRGQGYACPRCGAAAAAAGRRRVEVRRGLRAGTYLPPVSSQRHLARPRERYGVAGAARFDERLEWLAVAGAPASPPARDCRAASGGA